MLTLDTDLTVKSKIELTQLFNYASSLYQL
jgi:hypothetical protein